MFIEFSALATSLIKSPGDMGAPIKSLFDYATPIKPVDNGVKRRICKTIVVAGKEKTVEVKK